MCIESKTWLLAVSLESDILSRVHDADEAQEMLDEYTHSAYSKVAAMAKYYNKHREVFHLTETLGDAGTFTRLSLIRGAIKHVLDEYIIECEQGSIMAVFEPAFA